MSGLLIRFNQNFFHVVCIIIINTSIISIVSKRLLFLILLILRRLIIGVPRRIMRLYWARNIILRDLGELLELLYRDNDLRLVLLLNLLLLLLKLNLLLRRLLLWHLERWSLDYNLMLLKLIRIDDCRRVFYVHIGNWLRLFHDLNTCLLQNRVVQELFPIDSFFGVDDQHF